MKVTLVFDLAEDVTPEIFAARIAQTCADHYAIRPGESVIEPTSGKRWTATGNRLSADEFMAEFLPRRQA